ncbi:MAG: hypothetical protein AAGA30_11120, partial [Planctomycetota bacterium]
AISEEEQKLVYRPILQKADSNGDGLISRDEILDQLRISNSNQSEAPLDGRGVSQALGSETQPLSQLPNPLGRRMKLVVMKLPPSYAFSEKISTQDIFESARSGDTGSGEYIRLLDQFEFIVRDNVPTVLSSQGSRLRPLGRTNSRGDFVEYQEIPYGSSVRVLPKFSSKQVELDVEFEAIYGIPRAHEKDERISKLGRLESVKLSIDTKVLLSDQKSETINLLSSGNHFLIVLKVGE